MAWHVYAGQGAWEMHFAGAVSCTAMAEAVCMPYTQRLGFPKGKLMGAASLEHLQPSG